MGIGCFRFIIDTSSTNEVIPSLKSGRMKDEDSFYTGEYLLPAIRFINANYDYVATTDGWDVYKNKGTQY